MATQELPHGDSAGTILGHPKGLFVLFFAEMWERFSYYGMRALLIFYLTMHWAFSDSEGSLIYGGYTALVYIAPVVGGYLADKFLGQRKAVLFGAVLLTLGHLFMAFEGDATLGADNPAIDVFWLALALIIVGSGFLKANISVMVGQLYPRTDIRRDPAYTIFYMGINLGAAAGALLCGYLGLHPDYGWAYGFGAAGIGMLLGLVVFVWGKPLLLGRGEPSNPAKLEERVGGIKIEWWMYIVGLVAVALCWVAVQNYKEVGIFLGTFGAILVTYVIYIATFDLSYENEGDAPKALQTAMKIGGAVFAVGMLFASGGGTLTIGDAELASIGSTAANSLAGIGFATVFLIMLQQMISHVSHDRDRIVAAMFLIIVSVIFWALFEQAGSSLNLFTERHVNRELFGWAPTSAMFQSLNSIYIILLAPVFAILWTWMGQRGFEPSTPMKFGLAVVQVGLGFLVLVWGAQSVGVTVPTPVIFIFLVYLLHTTGELCLSPVGLSAMNRLAPTHLASLIMGTWFFASATGNFVAGQIAARTGADGLDEAAGKTVVLDVYSTVGMWAIGVGVVVMIISPLVKKLMHLESLQDDGSDDDLLGQAEIGEPQAAGTRPAQ